MPLTILLLGDRNPLMYAPRSVVTLLLASVVAGGLGQAAGRQPLVLVFLIIFLAGFFQALLGTLRLGNLGHLDSRFSSVLTDMGVVRAVGRDALSADADAAREWAEDQLILRSRSGAWLSDEVPLDRLTVLAGLTDAKRELVGRALGRRVYQRGTSSSRRGTPTGACS